MKALKIKQIVAGRPTSDGAGVKLVRVIGYNNVADFDPFLMLDAFDSTNPADYIKGFPWHPHRGIETVTYLIEGLMEHGDSLGHKGVIRGGGCQWMTAGSGIIHQEMPKESPRLLGLQFWLNLPKSDKMSAPAYHDAEPENVPVINKDGAEIRVIAGEYEGVDGPLKAEHVQALFMDVAVKPDAFWLFNADPEATVYVYIVDGSGYFDEQAELISNKKALLFDHGDELNIKAGPEGLRMVLCQGRPLKEPVAWGGPIVMNTQAELDQAFSELENNSFIKKNAG